MCYADMHNTMVNVTTRIAVRIKHLPPFDFDWGDTTPQKPRDRLTVDDVLPSKSDGDQLFQRAVKYVMEFLVHHFSSLKDLKLATDECAPCPEKSTVVPMPLLQRDEKYIDETINILHDYIHDCNFIGHSQVRF